MTTSFVNAVGKRLWNGESQYIYSSVGHAGSTDIFTFQPVIFFQITAANASVSITSAGGMAGPEFSDLYIFQLSENAN